MTTIKLTVHGANARAKVEGALISGGSKIRVMIQCDGSWGGLSRNLVCTSGKWEPENQGRAILNVGESVTVPHEVMIAGNHLYLGLEGRNPDGKLVIPTMWADCGMIQPGTGGEAEPTPPVWAQLQEQIRELENQ